MLSSSFFNFYHGFIDVIYLTQQPKSNTINKTQQLVAVSGFIFIFYISTIVLLQLFPIENNKAINMKVTREAHSHTELYMYLLK